VSGYESLFQSIKGIAESLQALNQQALREYTPIVEDILRFRSRDVHHIEHTLDGLLDFCHYEPILQLYKKLCRHYFYIDPVATAFYVNSYYEMWDSEPKAKKPRVQKKRPDANRKHGRRPRGITCHGKWKAHLNISV